MFELTLVTGKFNFNLRVESNLPTVADDATSPLGTYQLAMLAQQIQAVYTLNELRQASRFLDVEFDNLPGDTLFEKAYGLVSHFQYRSMATKLYARLATDRPHIHWQALFDKLPNQIVVPPTSTN